MYIFRHGGYAGRQEPDSAGKRDRFTTYQNTVGTITTAPGQ